MSKVDYAEIEKELDKEDTDDLISRIKNRVKSIKRDARTINKSHEERNKESTRKLEALDNKLETLKDVTTEDEYNEWEQEVYYKD